MPVPYIFLIELLVIWNFNHVSNVLIHSKTFHLLPFLLVFSDQICPLDFVWAYISLRIKVQITPSNLDPPFWYLTQLCALGSIEKNQSVPRIPCGMKFCQSRSQWDAPDQVRYYLTSQGGCPENKMGIPWLVVTN